MGTTEHSLRNRTLAAGEARCAVFTRTYRADLDNVWDACTDPERLRRWYQPVVGDLRLGGLVEQGMLGSGTVLACEKPHRLVLGLGPEPHPDQLTLTLAPTDGGTVLELEYATVFDTHEVAGGLFDAVYCTGGGYGPRLETLEQHLEGTLPEIDVTALHLRPESRPAIEGSMAALEKLLAAVGTQSVYRPMPV